MSHVTRCYPIARRAIRSRAREPETRTHAFREGGIDHLRVSRVARLLALAYCIEGLCENNVIADYAEASRRLGMTHARMSQVMNLLHLSPTIQQRILDGSLATTERSLRTVACLADWQLHLSGGSPARLIKSVANVCVPASLVANPDALSRANAR